MGVNKMFVNIISDFMNMTAWTMDKPKPYGVLHLSFMIIGFALSAFLAWRFRNVGERGNKAILLTSGIFLLVCELYKQLFYTFVVNPGQGYTWWIFPFQLCSIPMYFCIIIPLLRGGRVKRALCNFTVAYNLLGGAIAFLEPSGLLHGYWTLTLHALIWHMMLVFVGLYIGFSGRACTEKRDYLSATVTFLVLCVIAFSINCIFREVSDGSINMFFIGPRVSSLIIVKQIGERFGWYVGTLCYIPAVCLGAYIVHRIFCAVHRRNSQCGAEQQNIEDSLDFSMYR